MENVKGIESKIKSFSSFYHVALRKCQKIQKIVIVWRGGATGWHNPGMNLLNLQPLFLPWFRLLAKSDH